jgi:hypothetical protein
MARQARRWTRRLAFLTSGLVLAAASMTGADEIRLRGGGRINGVVVEKTDRTITIETGPGQVTFPLSLVEKIVESRSVLESWQERSRALSSGDVEGWAALARWAEAQALPTQAQVAWQHVRAIDPRHAEANAALGRVQVDGTWLSREEAYRAQGLVPFEGRWVSRAEYESLLQQRAAESAGALNQRQAQLRLREAEARAREAEARARDAEATTPTQPSDDNGGIPVWGGYGYGGYGYGYGGHGDSHGGRGHGRGGRGGGHGDHDGSPPERRPEPVPTPRPSSLGPTKALTPPHGQSVDASKRRGSSMH